MKPLQSDSVIPLYHQLKERLKDSIDSGHWKPGDKIPSENQLMNEYSVSRNTAKKAIEERPGRTALPDPGGRHVRGEAEAAAVSNGSLQFG
ncbi:GntR family transcriptional regulator [Bacillus sp. FJAT-27251]|uniref:GntR family transcriptional regulator n=1 Tax=Bacillus sp. FJAT-27251 TaxID=1684142 RepID=UPI001E42A8AD|nr:GntR family transcriptional regulator [Bacillus sp. FJAT-27251]